MNYDCIEMEISAVLAENCTEMDDHTAPRHECPKCKDMLDEIMNEVKRWTVPREDQHKTALECIVSRFEKEDKGGITTRSGLVWAMYSDAKSALAGKFIPQQEDKE